VSRPVDLIIITTGGITSALAAKNATRTIPVVFTRRSRQTRLGRQPRAAGRKHDVREYAHQRARREAAGAAARADARRTPDRRAGQSANPNAETNRPQLEAAVRSFGLRLHVASACVPSAIAAAFASFVAQGADALLV
jgi:hypothetical protein